MDKVMISRRIPLTVDMKRRLLKSIQAGVLNLSHFPEFCEHDNNNEVDISDFTDEEKQVLLKVARKGDR